MVCETRQAEGNTRGGKHRRVLGTGITHARHYRLDGTVTEPQDLAGAVLARWRMTAITYVSALPLEGVGGTGRVHPCGCTEPHLGTRPGWPCVRLNA